MTDYINKCFNMSEKDSNCYLREYFKIIQYRYQNPSSEKYSERHHIVPKCWFKMNGYETSNNDNIVILSIKEHLKVHVLLVYYFNSVYDEQMSYKMLNTIHRMTNEGCQQIKRYFELYGDLPKDVYDEFQNLRKMYYENALKNRRYTQDYLEKCFQIYGQYDDMYVAYEQVVKQMGFKYKRQSLLDRFKKWIDRDRYNDVIQRQMRYWRESGGYLMYKYGSLDNFKKHIEEKNEEKRLKKQKKHEITVLDLQDMYRRYQTYGVKYMKMKYPSFSTSMFLRKCGKFGIIDYKPSKDTTKKKILYEGQEYGLCELCRKLNVSGNDYQKIVSVHTTLGICYEEIFTEYVQGNLGKYEIKRKQNNGMPSFLTLKGSLSQISELGKDYGYDYLKVCEMHMYGMDVEEIRKKVFEVSGNEMM